MRKLRITLLATFLLAMCSNYAQNWQLVWADEFDYSGSPNSADWNMENWTPGWVNDEDQAYTDRLENARVENGNLIIEARKDNYNGWEWTSARLQTSHKHDILYGRVEVSAILPEGTGTWPAIWMLPSDWIYGGWPTCGEIDIMEHVGKDPGRVHASVHTETYNHTLNTQVTDQIMVSDYNTAYHTYAIEWTPTEIKMFVDESHYYTFQNDGTGYQAWPFDKPFHIILNVAMGGSWGGRISKRLTSAQMVIDYVRVYEGDPIVDNEAPSSPVSLNASPSSSSVSLTWEPATDNYSVKEYLIYQDNSLIGTTIWQDFYVSGLTPLSTYNFEVKARDYSGNESSAASVSVETIDVIINDIPAKIEAENFDAQSGVQTEATSDDGGGDNVGWIDSGDWMEYTVGVTAPGYFIVDYRLASLNGGCEIQLLDISGSVLATTSVPATGDWQAWVTVSSTPINLDAGTHKLRLYANVGGFNVNWLDFRSVPSPDDDTEAPSSPANLATSATSTTIDLSWDASTDNIAVAGYDVYLDGIFQTNTQGVSYQFTGLTKRTSYTLGVIALDVAGNESAMATKTTRTSAKSATVESTTIETKSSISFVAYPNPVVNKLQVNFAKNLVDGKVLLYTTDGKTALTYLKVNSNVLVLDMSNIPKGAYILEVSDINGKETKRILKK